MAGKLFENVGGNQFRLATEDRWARHHPEGEDFTDLEDVKIWSNYGKVIELKNALNSAIEAGNFDLAHEIIDKLSNYHN